MSAYSQFPSEDVLLCEAVKNGLDLDRYLPPVRDFTFFSENLDKNTNLNVHISSTKLNRIPGLGRSYIKLSLRGSDGRVWRARAMIDSSAERIFFNRKYVEKNRLECVRLQRPIPMFNIDGTLNKDGSIKETVSIQVEESGHVENLRCFVTELGDDDMILGLLWLEKHNPDVDWNTGKILIRGSAELGAEPSEDQPRFWKVATTRLHWRKWHKEGCLEHTPDEIWIAAGFTYSMLIAEKADGAKNARTYEEVILKHYRDFKKVFSEVELERLLEHKPWDHKIDLKPDTPSEHRSKNYPMSIDEQREVDKFLEENVCKGYIQSSQSPFAAPVFFVKKKDGKLCFIQDYRGLNKWTVKDWYLLPLSADIINRLARAKFFTKFDIRWGYNNICIRKSDEWKAAFTTNWGLFEPLVMFFELTNFQALMSLIFADLIAKGMVAVYLDDILIYTKTIKEHRKVMRKVLCRLKKNNLYLRPAKCKFECTKVEYLGMLIQENHVSMNPAKVQAVTDWPNPWNLKDVRGFLGFANFYCRFIEGFARIAQPLNDLTKKDVPWSGGQLQQEAFTELKARFTSSPVLVMWQSDLEMRMEVDASAFATGGVISQKQTSDGLHHPIAFHLESLSELEHNYEIYDRKLLAIVQGLEDWGHYLMGLPELFTIATDHRNLEYWTKARNLNCCQARWYLTLAEYNFTLVHKPGSSMIVSDLMSQDPAK
jgi:hypothetical protein